MLRLTLSKANTVEIDTTDGLIVISLGRIKPGTEGVVLGFEAPRRIGIVRSDAIVKVPRDGRVQTTHTD